MPTIFPASGLYRPPLSVSLSGAMSGGDKLYYIIEESDGQVPTVRKRLYSEPFLLQTPGRARITAFVWRPGFGEGQSVSNIFMLDNDGKPGSQSNLDPQRVLSVIAPKQHSKKPRSVVFTNVPREIRSLETFSISIALKDEADFMCASSFSHPVKVAVSAEVMGEAATSLATLDIPASAHLSKLLPPPFVQTSNALVQSTTDSSGVHVGRSGKGGSWNSFADSTPCISGSQTPCASIKFRVHSLSRVIVGLHLGLEDVSSEMSWRALPYSFHFSADLSDSSTVPAFRIYESGRLVEDAGTEEFDIGDEFSIRVRPNGDVSYLRNGNILVTTPGLSSAVYSVHVRIAAQLGDVAISGMTMVADSDPFSATLENLLWKPKVIDGPAIREKIVLRAWIAGTDYVPATAGVDLKTNCIPRWAVAALNLASMFALGTCGSQSNHVGVLMNDGHRSQAPLQVVENASSGNRSTTTTRNNAGTDSPQFLS